MKLLTYADIMDEGTSVFTAVAQVAEKKLHVEFKGVIRIENPYNQLFNFIEELKNKLTDIVVHNIVFDFTELNYCNSNGFYVLMDIVEMVYQNLECPVVIKRLQDDDWQQETLPILLNIEEDEISDRTVFVELERV